MFGVCLGREEGEYAEGRREVFFFLVFGSGRGGSGFGSADTGLGGELRSTGTFAFFGHDACPFGQV